jgi:amino acid transporter
VLNTLGATIVGEAEELVVAIKVLILLLFIVTGVWSVDTGRLQPAAWSPPLQLVAGGMIIFLAYEGFELIANSAADVRNPRKNLPVAYFASVGFVIFLYIMISAVTAGNLPIREIISARDYALAESARPFLGKVGFILITIAALLSTGSAINATLYGASRISYVIAKEGELPEVLERKVWRKPIEGLLIISGITLLVANLFDLSSISMMGSAGFLIIFAAVNAANVLLFNKTMSSRWISALGAAICLSALGALVWYTAATAPLKLLVLAFMLAMAFAIEAIYRKVSGRSIRPFFERQPLSDDKAHSGQ